MCLARVCVFYALKFVFATKYTFKYTNMNMNIIPVYIFVYMYLYVYCSIFAV